MFRPDRRRTVVALAATALAAGCGGLLTACAAATPEATAQALDASTERFVACLQAGGLDPRTTENGRVLVKVPIEVGADGIPERVAPPPQEGSPNGSVSLEVMDGAVYQGVDDPDDFPEEWNIAPVYADCLAEVPEFEQAPAESDGSAEQLDPDEVAAQTDLLLAFAECARENGVSGFPDPEQGAMLLPASIDEDTLRSLLTACSDDLADSEAPLSVHIEATADTPPDEAVGKVFEEFPELTDHGFTMQMGMTQ